MHLFEIRENREPANRHQVIKSIIFIFREIVKILIKVTVSIISIDVQCKDGNVRFKTVPLQPLTH